jgi:hypothetical protein
MKKRLSILFIICALACQSFAQTGTFHLICDIDRYSNIAESCKKDFENIKAFLSDVASDLKILIKVYDIEFYATDSKKFISDFKCGPNDIVFYYYSGHGFRYDDQDVVWPYLNVCKKDNDPIEKCALSLNWVYQEIEKKGPRLAISMGDCCNSLIGMNEPKMSLSRNLTFRNQHQPEGYKKLFLETKGIIVASGCIPGQYSLGTDEGGIYTNSLIEVLKNSRENSSVNWKVVLAKATSIAETNSNKEQKPQFMIADSDGKFYSEGKYPENLVIADVNNNVNNNINNINNNVNNNVNSIVNNDNPDNQDYNVYDDEDYKEYEDNYDDTEMESEALYSMGFIYILGLSSDDENISDKELNSFYDFFNSTMTDWGYESENVDQFTEELAKWIEKIPESEMEAELTNSLSILKKYYDKENYNTIVFENLVQMVDNPDSEGFKNIVAAFKSM